MRRSKTDGKLNPKVDLEAPKEDAVSGLRIKRLGMASLIAADAALFLAVLIACAWIRISNHNWPREFSQRLAPAAVMTAILFASSLTMTLAARAARRNRRRPLLPWLLATLAGAIFFSLAEIHQWVALIRQGLTLSHNPWGTPALGASFFALTGLHLVHVAAGVLYLLVLVASASRQRRTSEHVKICNLYWQYTCILWLFVLPFVYLPFSRTP